jgi:AcrR family transcriptional regulator
MTPEKTTASTRPGRWTKTQRKRQIAEITLQLIAAHGVQSVTLRQIAGAAGISPPALYNHFSNRTEILVAVADLIKDRVFEWIDSSQTPNIFERLRELAGSAHDSSIVDHPEAAILPLFELIAAGRDEQLTAQLAERQLATVQRLADIVDQGKKQGTIRQDVDSRVVAWSLLGFGYAKDVVLLQGVSSFVTDGTADKILDKLLSDVAATPGEPSS